MISSLVSSRGRRGGRHGLVHSVFVLQRPHSPSRSGRGVFPGVGWVTGRGPDAVLFHTQPLARASSGRIRAAPLDSWLAAE